MPKITITPEQEKVVASMLDTWKGTLTWDLLGEKVAASFGIADGVTRQTLSARPLIKLAFKQAKERLRGVKEQKSEPSYDVEYYKNQIIKLEAELQREKEKVARYEARFVRWQYNAYLNGIPVHSLDNPTVEEALKDQDTLTMLEQPLTALNRQHRTDSK